VEFARFAARRPAGCYHLTSGNSCIERLQAARHSTLVMCVAASQNRMQSASDLPPPPGLLGAASLPDEVPGERARLGEEPPPVANWLGNGSDMGDSGGTVEPGCAVVGAVGVVVVGAPAGGVSPDEGVGDNVVDGAAVVPGLLGGTLGVGRVLMLGAESLGLGAAAGALPADERACANAFSGSSSTRAMAARTVGLGVSIAITMTLPAVPSLVTIGPDFCSVHNLASGVKRAPPLRHGECGRLWLGLGWTASPVTTRTMPGQRHG